MDSRSCSRCGKQFQPRTPTAEFCSRECRGAAQRRTNVCPVCGTSFTKRSKTCSRACAVALRKKTEAEQTRICQDCGKLFTPTSSTAKYCEGPHYKKCQVCQNSFEVEHPNSKVLTCSSKCAGVLINSEDSKRKRKETNLRNYGVESYSQTDEFKAKTLATNLERYGAHHALATDAGMEKLRTTNQERYGTDYAIQNEEVRKKAEATNLARFNHTNPFGSAEIQQRIRETVLEAYGCEYPMQNTDVASRQKQTCVKRYGVPNPSMVEEFKSKAQQTFSQHVQDGTIVHHHRVSKVNRAIAEVLKKTFNTDVLLEQPLGAISTDFYIPSKNLYLDYHPTVSHNLDVAFGCVIGGCAQPCAKHNPIPRSYHFNRARQAQALDKTLIQWYQFDGTDSMMALLNGKLGQGFTKVSARKLTTVSLSARQANEFLSRWHIQGAVRGQTACYGLRDSTGELLAVATFGPARFGNKAEWEFLRYAVRANTVIHGGSAQLFRRFVAENQPTSVVSYVSFDHTTKQHTFLNSLGFEEAAPTGAGVVWFRVKDSKKVSANALTRLGADRLLSTSYGPKLDSGFSNEDIMRMEGFLPIPTSGNRVFVWTT